MKYTVTGRPLFDVQVEADNAAQAEERWREALHALANPALPDVAGIEMAFFTGEAPGGEPLQLSTDECGDDVLGSYLDGYVWTAAQVKFATDMGWGLSQYDDGQVVIGADEDRDVFVGEDMNVEADAHVRAVASGNMGPALSATEDYTLLCQAAVKIADESLAARIREVGEYIEGYDFPFKPFGDGELVAQDERYSGDPERCPSKHHNPGDDVCSDCGLYLNGWIDD